ncbi:MAG: four helix bundle protein [Gemmata sp.]
MGAVLHPDQVVPSSKLKTEPTCPRSTGSRTSRPRKTAGGATRALYKPTRATEFAHDYGPRDQIRKASVPSMSNIGEGRERDGNAELRQVLYIAKGSAGDRRSKLYASTSAKRSSTERPASRSTPWVSSPASSGASSGPNVHRFR